MPTNEARKVDSWDEEVTDVAPKQVDSWDEEVVDEPVKKKVTPSPSQTQSSSNGLNLLSGVIPSGKALLTGQKEESAPTEQKPIDLTNAPIAEDESTRTDKFIRKPIDKKKVDEIYTLSKQNESLVDEFSKSHFVLDNLSQTEAIKQLNDLYAKREQAKDPQTAQAIDNQIEVIKSQPVEKQPSIQEAVLQNAQKYGSQPQDFNRPEIPMNPLTPNQILERNGMKTANTVGELHDRYIESATKLNELRPELDKTAAELDAFKKDARTADFKTDKSGNKTLEGLADIPEAFGHGFGGTMKSIEQGFVNLLGDKQDRIDYAKKRYLEDNILYPTRTKGMATSGSEMIGGVAPYVISTAVLPETALLGHIITNGLTMGVSGYGNGYYEMFAKQKQQGVSDEEADAIAMQNAKFEGAKETAIGASLPFMGGAGSKLFLAPAEKSAMKQFLATQGVIIPTFTAGKLASNVYQKYGLGEKDVNLGDGLAETAENGLILGAMMEFAHKAPPKLKELYRANLSEQYPSIQQSVDKAVKDGVMDASQGYVFTEKLKRDFAVFNAMPKDITTEQKLAIEPEVKQIIELSSREPSAVESPEVTKDKIVQLQKQVAEKLGTPLTEKELEEKVSLKKKLSNENITKDEKLLIESKLKHFDAREDTAKENETKLAEEKKVAEAETPTNVGVEEGSGGVGGAKIKLDPDLANIDPIIIAARNGDKKAQEKLEEYGLDWEQTTTYRFVGQSEVDVLLANNKVESKRGTADAGIDVTTSSKVTSAANNEYRVTFKESFDLNNGLGKVKLKSKEEGDHHLEKGRGYDINDVAKIERIDENGNVIEVVYEQSIKETTKAESNVEEGSGGVGGDVKYTEEQTQEYKQRGFEQNDNGIWVHKGTNPVIKKVLNGWVGKLFASNGGTHAGNIHKEGSGIAGSLGKFNFKTGKTPFLDLVFGKDKTDSDYFVTLSHEMGHDIFERLTPEEKAIIEKNQNLTDSAKAHKENRDNKGELENNASDAEESWSDYVSAFLGKKLFDVAIEEYNAIPKEILPILEANVKIPKEVLSELGVEQSLKETTKAESNVEEGSGGVGGDVEGFGGGTKIYRAGGKGRYFTTDKQYIQEGGFKGETREFEIPKNTKLLDLREEDYKGILDLATEEERSILRKPQAKNSIEAKEQGNIVDAILKRNGYDGYIIKDAGETKDFDTVVFRKDKSPDLKAVEQSLKETTKAETPTTTQESNVVEGSGGVGGDVPQFAAKSEKHFEYVPIEEVDAYKEFDRETDKKFDKKELDDLTDDIRKNGIKKPIQIKVDRNGKALIVEGNTRLAAAKRLGIKNIPVEIIEGEFGSINKDKAKSLPDVGRSELQRRQQTELGLKDNNGAYSKGFTRVEQSIKETTKSETTTTNTGVEEGSVGVGGDVGRKPIGDGKFVRYNPDDVLPLLPDYKPTNTGAVEDYVNQVVPNDASVEAYKTVPLDAIQTSEKIESKDRKAIDKIKEGIKNGDDIPPLVLDFSPVIKNGESYKFGLMDGHHRYIAYKELGIKEVPAAIVTSREHYTFETNDTNVKTLFGQSLKETTKAEKETVAETVTEKGVEEPITEEIKTAIDNGEITREQADDYIKNNDGAKSESTIEAIERKAESENEAELNSAIDQADKLIGEAVGATEGEKQPTDKGTSEDKVTGIKKAMVEKDRETAGLPPIELPKSNKPQEKLERAKELVDSGEVDPSERESYLISHLENPFDAETSVVDQYILLYQRMKIEARSKEILTERMAIEDRLKEDPTDVQANLDLASNEIARQQNIYDLDRNTTASSVTSSIWGEIGNAKQQVINELGIVQEQINRIKELHGKDVPKEVQDKLDSLEKKNTELTARIEAIEKNITEQIAQGQLNKESRKPLIRRTSRRSDEEINAQIKDKLSTIANKIAERIEKSAVKNFAANKEQSKSLIADIAPDVMDVVKLVSEKTGNKLEDVVNKTYDTIKDIAEGIGKRDIVDIIAGKYSDKKPLSELQKQINDIRSQARLNERIDELEKGILRETQKRGESSEEVKKLRERANELMKKSKNDLANFSANELKKQAEQLQKKIDKGEFLPQKTVKKAFEQDANWVKYSQEKKKLKQELNHLEAQTLYDKKNLYMKTLDQFNKFSRLGLFIFSTAYQLKLSAAALSTIAHKPIEDLVGTAIKPMVKEIADRAPIEGRNINAEATAEFYKNLSPIKILRGAYQILSKGESDLSRELSSHPKKEGNIFNPLSDHSVLNWIADDPHKIIKNPIKQGIFDASLANYMNYYASKGMDINDPILIEKARQASYMRAEYEIFMGGENSKTAVSEWFKKMESEGILDAQSESFKTKFGGNLKYSISALKNFIVPIVSVPANILNRTVKNNPISTAYRFSEAMKTNSELKNNVTETLDNLTEAQADLMLRDLKKGAIGSVYWTLGFIMAGNALGGFFNKSYPDKKRDKDEKGHDEMEIFGKNIPHGVQHAVPLQQMQMAATFALTLKYFNEKDRVALKDSFDNIDVAKNAAGASAEIARSYVHEHPYSKAAIDIKDALEGGKGREKYLNNVYRRSDIPQFKFLLQDLGVIEKDDSYKTQKTKSDKHKEVKDFYDIFWYMMDDKKFDGEDK